MDKFKPHDKKSMPLKHKILPIKPSKPKYLSQNIQSYEDTYSKNEKEVECGYCGRKSLKHSKHSYEDFLPLNFAPIQNHRKPKLITKIKMQTAKLGTDISLALLSNQEKLHSTNIFADVFYAGREANSFNKYQTLNVYIPCDNKIAHPVLFYFHGGAWSSGDKAYYSEFCQKIADSGVVVVNINYRLLPKNTFEDILDDCTTAIIFALNNSVEYKIDPHTIFIAGDSAGAHLSAMLANILITKHHYNRKHLKGLILFYGAYNLTTFDKSTFGIVRTLDEYLRSVEQNIEDFFRANSPVNISRKNIPTPLIICGQRDKLYDQTVEFMQVLNEKNVHYEKLIFPKSQLDAIHGFLNISNSPSSKKAIDRVIKFIKDKVR